MTTETQTTEATAEATADSTALAEPASGGNLAHFDLNVPGMEGLELSFGSVPYIKLDKGEFICDEFDVDPEFDVILLASKSKHFYKCSDEDHPIPFFYTYDEKETVSGEPVDAILDAWQEAGNRWTSNKYLEVLARMLPSNAFVILSVSPKSVGRYTRYVGLDLMQARGLKPQEVVTTVRVGPRIDSKFPFRPWDFMFKCKLDEYEGVTEE